MTHEQGYRRIRLADVPPNAEKPGERREVSSALDVPDYNYNVAHLPPRTRLSRSGYHAHPEQREFYHVLAGRCRVEVDDGAFVMVEDDCCQFDADVAHMLHNPYDEPCRLVAVGAPPAAHHPVRQVADYETFVAERYGGEVPTEDPSPRAGDDGGRGDDDERTGGRGDAEPTDVEGGDR